MSSESLHNYFGITVKRRKNDEKFGIKVIIKIIKMKIKASGKVNRGKVSRGDCKKI